MYDPTPDPVPDVDFELAMRRALAAVRAHAAGDHMVGVAALAQVRGTPGELGALLAALAGLPSLAVAQRPDDVVEWCDSLLASLA